MTTTDSEKVSPPAGKPNKGTDAGKTDADRLPARPGHAQRAGAFGFPVHPQRSAATGEVHARPAPSITAPRALLKLCFITDGGASVDQAVLAELSRQHGVAPPAETARHHRIRTGPGSLWWERHTEASTYLWEGPLPEAAGETLTGHPFGDAFPAPGSLIAGVRIDIRPHGDGTLLIDAAQAGVGGDTGWNLDGRAHMPYRIALQPLTYSFTIGAAR